MLVLVVRKLQGLLGSTSRSLRRRTPRAAAPKRICLGIETLEGRDVPSHAAAVVVPHSESAIAVATHDAVLVSSHTHNIAAPAPAAHAPVPAAKPAPAHPAKPAPVGPAKPAPGHSPVAHPAPTPPLVGIPEPWLRIAPPTPPPVVHLPPPSLGWGPAFNPTTYIPKLCTTATFSGNMGANGYYSSFTIVGHNYATGTTIIISYAGGNDGAPYYKWTISANTQSPGNGSWGSEAIVYQPYYISGMPLSELYPEPPHGPG